MKISSETFKLGLLASAFYFVSGCSTLKDLRTVPDSHKEKSEILKRITPVNWSTNQIGIASASISWEDFDDPLLHELIRTCFENNLNLENAYLAVEQATNSFSVLRQEKKFQYGSEITTVRSEVEGFEKQETYTFSSFAQYEIDLWNKVGARVEDIALELDSANEDILVGRITLASTLAELYFNIRVQDRILELRREQLSILEHQKALQSIRLKAGAITRLDIDQLDVEIQSLESNIESLNASRQRAEQNMAILIGIPPNQFNIKPKALDMFDVPRLKPEAPSELILNRPDIRKAEREIRRANLSLQQARTNYLPDFILQIAGTKSTDNVSDFLSLNNIVHSTIGTISQTLLDDGDRKVEKKNSKISVSQELNNYELTILDALIEVEAALIDQNKNLRQISILQSQLKAQQRASKITKVRYESGNASAFDFIREQQTILTIKEQEVLNWQQGLSTAISLLRILNIQPTESNIEKK